VRLHQVLFLEKDVMMGECSRDSARGVRSDCPLLPCSVPVPYWLNASSLVATPSFYVTTIRPLSCSLSI
jgi:hypothetical protein